MGARKTTRYTSKRDGDDALSITNSPRRTRISKRTRRTAEGDAPEIAAQVKAAREKDSDRAPLTEVDTAGRSKRDAAQNASKTWQTLKKKTRQAKLGSSDGDAVAHIEQQNGAPSLDTQRADTDRTSAGEGRPLESADDFPGARFQLSLEEDEGKLRSKVSNAVQGRDLHAAGRLAGKRAKAKTGKKVATRARSAEAAEMDVDRVASLRPRSPVDDRLQGRSDRQTRGSGGKNEKKTQLARTGKMNDGKTGMTTATSRPTASSMRKRLKNTLLEDSDVDVITDDSGVKQTFPMSEPGVESDDEDIDSSRLPDERAIVESGSSGTEFVPPNSSGEEEIDDLSVDDVAEDIATLSQDTRQHGLKALKKNKTSLKVGSKVPKSRSPRPPQENGSPGSTTGSIEQFADRPQRNGSRARHALGATAPQRAGSPSNDENWDGFRHDKRSANKLAKERTVIPRSITDITDDEKQTHALKRNMLPNTVIDITDDEKVSQDAPVAAKAMYRAPKGTNAPTVVTAVDDDVEVLSDSDPESIDAVESPQGKKHSLARQPRRLRKILRHAIKDVTGKIIMKGILCTSDTRTVAIVGSLADAAEQLKEPEVQTQILQCEGKNFQVLKSIVSDRISTGRNRVRRSALHALKYYGIQVIKADNGMDVEEEKAKIGALLAGQRYVYKDAMAQELFPAESYRHKALIYLLHHMLFVRAPNEKNTLYARNFGIFRTRRPNGVGYDEVMPKEVVAGAATMLFYALRTTLLGFKPEDTASSMKATDNEPSKDDDDGDDCDDDDGDDDGSGEDIDSPVYKEANNNDEEPSNKGADASKEKDAGSKEKKKKKKKKKKGKALPRIDSAACVEEFDLHVATLNAAAESNPHVLHDLMRTLFQSSKNLDDFDEPNRKKVVKSFIDWSKA